MIDILIVDDHTMMLMGLKELLEKEPNFHVVATLSEPDKIEEFIQSRHPNVLIIDVRLKNSNGLTVAKQLHRLFPNLKIVILSGYGYEEYADAAMQAGADAFVSKEASNRQLIWIIQEVNKGRKIFPHAPMPDNSQKLTARELEILKLIAKDMTNAEISQSLLISKRTVEYHIASILQKLDADSRVGAIVNGIKRGLLNI